MELNGRKVGLKMVIEDENAGERNGSEYNLMMEVAGIEALPGGPGPEIIRTVDTDED